MRSMDITPLQGDLLRFFKVESTAAAAGEELGRKRNSIYGCAYVLHMRGMLSRRPRAAESRQCRFLYKTTETGLNALRLDALPGLRAVELDWADFDLMETIDLAPPTSSFLMEELGWGKGKLQYRLDKLRNAGHVENLLGRPRRYALTRKGQKALKRHLVTKAAS